jgi:hypothetical protein
MSIRITMALLLWAPIIYFAYQVWIMGGLQ